MLTLYYPIANLALGMGDKLMNRITNIAIVVLSAVMIADPAYAGTIVRTPAPVAGLGVGAIALLGMGYRALKGRMNK